VGARSRERLGRLALFLLSVVILCILAGVLISQVGIGHIAPKTVATLVTFASVAISYLAAYSPGWLYKSLLDVSNDTSEPGGPK
jgi:hypothetical protein